MTQHYSLAQHYSTAQHYSLAQHYSTAQHYSLGQHYSPVPVTPNPIFAREGLHNVAWQRQGACIVSHTSYLWLLYRCITSLMQYCTAVSLYRCITVSVIKYCCITVYYCMAVLLYSCFTLLLFCRNAVLLLCCITVLLCYLETRCSQSCSTNIFVIIQLNK